MRLFKLLALGLFTCGIILASQSANAANIQTYTFEGLGDLRGIPTNYIPGISFSSNFESNYTPDHRDTTQWQVSTVSGVIIAFNNSSNMGRDVSFQSIDPNNNFSLISGYFSSIWLARGGDITAIGYDNGTEKYRQAININGGVPPLTTLNFNNIDKVDFITYGKMFGLDNLTLDLAPVPPTPPPPSPAPEPSSMVLGLMGLGSIFGLKRK